MPICRGRISSRWMEWYKAAHYDHATTSYFASPTGTATPVGCSVPGAAPNTANCGGAVGRPSDTAGYRGSPSPSGTFDQGGNVWEWTESASALQRRSRGGGFDSAASQLSSSSSGQSADPQQETANRGFRLLPEPSRLNALFAGIAALLGLNTARSSARRGDRQRNRPWGRRLGLVDARGDPFGGRGISR